MAATKRGLGKGLGALMGESNIQEGENKENVKEVDILLVDNDKNQPRKNFDKEKLDELAQSIKTHGIMQPILVYENNGRYTIVAGERRFRAAKIAGLKKIPVIVRSFTDRQRLELSLIENIQREDLNPLEQAMALHELVTQYKVTQEEVAERVGKKRSTIANLMRLLSLPESVKQMVREEKLSAGHARSLLPLDDMKLIEETANTVVNKNWSVRQTEEYVRKMTEAGKRKKTSEKRPAPAELVEAQDTLSEVFETKVRIQGDSEHGKIVIDYYTRDQLEQIYEAMKSLRDS